MRPEDLEKVKKQINDSKILSLPEKAEWTRLLADMTDAQISELVSILEKPQATDPKNISDIKQTEAIILKSTVKQHSQAVPHVSRKPLNVDITQKEISTSIPPFELEIPDHVEKNTSTDIKTTPAPATAAVSPKDLQQRVDQIVKELEHKKAALSNDDDQNTPAKELSEIISKIEPKIHDTPRAATSETGSAQKSATSNLTAQSVGKQTVNSHPQNTNSLQNPNSLQHPNPLKSSIPLRPSPFKSTIITAGVQPNHRSSIIEKRTDAQPVIHAQPVQPLPSSKPLSGHPSTHPLNQQPATQTSPLASAGHNNPLQVVNQSHSALDPKNLQTAEDFETLTPEILHNHNPVEVLDLLMAIIVERAKKQNFFKIVASLEHSPLYRTYMDYGKHMLDGNQDQSLKFSKEEFEAFTDFSADLDNLYL